MINNFFELFRHPAGEQSTDPTREKPAHDPLHVEFIHLSSRCVNKGPLFTALTAFQEMYRLASYDQEVSTDASGGYSALFNILPLHVTGIEINEKIIDRVLPFNQSHSITVEGNLYESSVWDAETVLGYISDLEKRWEIPLD